MFKHRLFVFAVVLATGVSAECSYAAMIFNVMVNTSSLSGQNGFLDFQFNPGNSGALAADTTVDSFMSVGGVLAQPALLTGDATGSLPGALMFDNGTIYNDAFQGFTFGSSFDFRLTLSGPAVDNPSGNVGSAFAVSLYAADQVTPLLTTDPYGSIATIGLNPDGTSSVITFPESATDTAGVAAVTAGESATPEPGTMLLVMQGVLILAYKSRRMKALA